MKYINFFVINAILLCLSISCKNAPELEYDPKIEITQDTFVYPSFNLHLYNNPMKGDNHYYVYQDSFLNSKFIILLPLKLTADSIEESCYTQSIGLFPSFSVGSEIKNIKLRSKTKNTCDIYMVKSNDILKDLGQRTYESFSDSHSMLHTIDYFGTGVIMRNQFFYSTYSSFDTLNSRILLSQFCLNLSKKTFYLLNINVSLGKEDKEVYFENNLSFLIKKVGNSQ